MCLIMSMFAASMAVAAQTPVTMGVTMIVSAVVEEPGACNIDGEAQAGNQNRFGNVDLAKMRLTDSPPISNAIIARTMPLVNLVKGAPVSGPICSLLSFFKTASAIEGKESRPDRGSGCSPD